MGEENDDIEALTAEIEDLRRRIDGLSRNLRWLSVFVVLLFMVFFAINSGVFFFIVLAAFIVLAIALVYCYSMEKQGL